MHNLVSSLLLVCHMAWHGTEADVLMCGLACTAQVVALVGPSGGGKSSCVALLEHLYEPDQGSVLLDGRGVKEYDHTCKPHPTYWYTLSSASLIRTGPVCFSCAASSHVSAVSAGFHRRVSIVGQVR